MSNEVSLEEFESYLAQKNHTLKHWALPSTTLVLKKIELGKYELDVLLDDEKKYETSENFNFQIHYDSTQRLIGLFVMTYDRGWFLDTVDLFERSAILLTIYKMFKEKRELMDEIYQRESKNG